MGFFSDLKNNLTGSWADVSITTSPAKRGESASFTVQVNVKDKAIDVNKIYVKVQCVENVEIRNVRTNSGTSQGSTSGSNTTTARANETLFDQEIQVASATQLGANSQQSFEASVQLPAHMPPTFAGRNARIEWKVMAAVDMKGNDPDSGYQTFEVS